MSAQHDYEHRLWKILKEENLTNKKFLLAVSGGLDSVALVALFLSVIDKNQFAIFHFHHGEGQRHEYRDQALIFTQNLAQQKNIKFYSQKWHGLELKSEDDFRKARYQALNEKRVELDFDYIVTAHHADDLLETRLIRLIRGTGPQGLKAMKIREDNIFRPLLTFGRKDLEQYINEKSWSYIEDPSNCDQEYLRNWLRRDWLPQLEVKRSGSVMAMARSLELLSETLDVLPKNNDSEGILISEYLSLVPSEQRRRLACYLLLQGVRDFTQSHLEEIQKRLDSSQKVHTFKVAGCYWTVNAERIQVELRA